MTNDVNLPSSNSLFPTIQTDLLDRLSDTAGTIAKRPTTALSARPARRRTYLKRLAARLRVSRMRQLRSRFSS